MNQIEAQWWGRVEYSEAVDRQVRLRDQVIARGAGGYVVFVEHPPVVTCGRNHDPSPEEIHRIRAHGMDFQRSSRGGQLTYHGPGQLVMYPILHLGWLKMGVKEAVTSVTDSMINWLDERGIDCEWRDDAPGVWTRADSPRKLASVGMRITRQVTWHGGALNLTTDMSAFSVFQPCGFSGSVMTSVGEVEDQSIDSEEVARELCLSLGKVLNHSIALPEKWQP